MNINWLSTPRVVFSSLKFWILFVFSISNIANANPINEHCIVNSMDPTGIDFVVSNISKSGDFDVRRVEYAYLKNVDFSDIKTIKVSGIDRIPQSTAEELLGTKIKCYQENLTSNSYKCFGFFEGSSDQRQTDVASIFFEGLVDIPETDLARKTWQCLATFISSLEK